MREYITYVGKIGLLNQSLFVRIPKAEAKRIQLRKGQKVTVLIKKSTNKPGIVLNKK